MKANRQCVLLNRTKQSLELSFEELLAELPFAFALAFDRIKKEREKREIL